MTEKGLVRKHRIWYVVDAIQLLLIALLLESTLFRQLEVGTGVRLLVIIALLIALVRSYVFFVLLAIQGTLLIREPGLRNLSWNFDSLLIAFQAFILIAYTCSVQRLRPQINDWVTSILYRQRPTMMGKPATESESSVVKRLSLWFGLGVVGYMAIIASSCFLLQQFPFGNQGPKWIREAVTGIRFSWFGPDVLLIAIVLMLVLSEWGWRESTPFQARLFLRSAFLFDYYSDLRRIVRRILRQQLRSEIKKP